MHPIAFFFLLLLCVSCSHPQEQIPEAHRLSVLIQPLGPIPPGFLDGVASALKREHDADAHIAEGAELPQHAFTDIRSPRYRADTLIAWLRSTKPDSIDLIIGITAADISITKYDSTGAVKVHAWKYRDFGIFGLGYLGGPSCIVSTYRLGDTADPHFFDRLKKIAVHELGHNRGLPHCADPTCVMRDAVERMSSIDRASPTFCADCRARLADRP